MKVVRADDLNSGIMWKYKQWIGIVRNIANKCNNTHNPSKDKNTSSAMARIPEKLVTELPNPRELNAVFNLLDEHNKSDNKVLIVDDIDFDGTGACYIVYQYLKQYYNAKVETYCNNKHGFSGEDVKNLTKEYDLIIIVDSSSTLVESYEDIETDILILDHHDISLQQHITTYYAKSRVVVCNSITTPSLQSISAGMLCYIVMHKYCTEHLPNNGTLKTVVDDELGISDLGMENNVLDLYEIGAVTNISDIVPVDETVAEILVEYLLHRNKETEFICSLLRSATDPIDKYRLQWRIIPLINYARRLSDRSTIDLLYHNNIKAAVPYLQQNHTKGRNIVQQLKSQTENKLHRYNNFVYVDITDQYETLGEDIVRFTGLFCNVLQDQFNVPSIVSVNTPKGIKLSIRSNRINSLTFFSNCESLEGGGHKSACGFYATSYEDLYKVLQDYDYFLSGAEIEETILVQYDNINDMLSDEDDIDMFSASLYNELCFSNLTPLVFKLNKLISDHVSIKPIANDEYDLSIDEPTKYNQHLTLVFMNKNVDLNRPVLIKPLYYSQDKNKFKLICRNI